MGATKKLLAFASLPILAAVASPIADSTLTRRVVPSLNGTAEYDTACKTCPYALCPNVVIVEYQQPVSLTCWTNGETVGDTKTWLKTSDGCFVTEYDLVEYDGDFTSELKYCGKVPFDLPTEDASVRYLTECKWGPTTREISTKYYGRDVDLTLVCHQGAGEEILGNPHWYLTTDKCYVSETGLWDRPDRRALEGCGPAPPPYINESDAVIDPAIFDKRVNLKAPKEEKKSLLRRWLQPGLVGEEYAYCHKCASANSSCPSIRRYEFNDTVISQCYTDEEVIYANGSFNFFTWMLTTDWCYVNGDDFWDPPWDYYRYPRCNNWAGY